MLIVEDEPYLAEAIRDGLRLPAIAADIAGDGDTALELLSINTYDIAVLDRDIPGPSGDEIATHHRLGQRHAGPHAYRRRPIDDKASGFELGADDYLTKPFDLQELVLRLRALDRRCAHLRPPVRHIAGLRLILIRSDLLRTFALAVAYAVPFLLVFGLLGGWILAGRMLAPLTRIIEATRMAATGSLAHRIEMEGREDEFRELADAFDAMLARLESASWGARVIGHIDDNLAVLARREAAIEGRGCLGQCEC